MLWHKELNCEIIVQIACGADHLAALSDRGTLFTSGENNSGQLGSGTFQSSRTFQFVPITEFDRVQAICCGWASTSVLTENGKVCLCFLFQTLHFPLCYRLRITCIFSRLFCVRHGHLVAKIDPGRVRIDFT